MGTPVISRRCSSTLFGLLMIAAAASHATEQSAQWTLRLRSPGSVLFNGVPRLDGQGSPDAQFLYPAPGAAGLFAAILAHGVIADQASRTRQSRDQEYADRVWAPYRPALDSVSLRELMQLALVHSRHPAILAPMGNPSWPLAAMTVQIDARIWLTSDHGALIVDTICIFGGAAGLDGQDKPLQLRLVSAPRDESALPVGDDATRVAALMQELALLLGQSLDIVLDRNDHPPTSPTIAHRTFRYALGKTRQAERAQLLEQDCSRQLLRTLRGNLLSVPRWWSPDDNRPAECAAADAASSAARMPPPASAPVDAGMPTPQP